MVGFRHGIRDANMYCVGYCGMALGLQTALGRVVLMCENGVEDTCGAGCGVGLKFKSELGTM